MILSPEELRELTGYKPASKQRAWLDSRNIPYRDEGRILVSKAAVERWLSGVEVVSRGPRLELVR